VRGITLSGGHPLEAYNLLDIYLLLTDIRTKFPDKDVWLYTGFTLPLSIFSPVDKNDVDGLAHNMVYSILSLCDVVVDGPFIQEQRDIRLQFRGSTNQRLIDVAKTLENKEITLWENN
jgi:anaerobic ribonucleoside-triphosphate reductase activating protein